MSSSACDSGIVLLNASSIDGGMTASLTTALAREFHVSVALREHVFDLRSALDKTRGQYLSSVLLRTMLPISSSTPEAKLLAIVDVDLYAPVLTFVFGEAQLGGTVGVLSTFRLHNEFYGLPEDPVILRSRIVKEAVHEAGHLCGLIHCRDFECVMRSSTYVEEIDLKRETLCRACATHFGVAASSPRQQ